MDLSKVTARTKKQKSKRLGRGTGSGKGKTSGRGHNGAGQRSGKALPYAGFRGGNLPMVRVLPKRGFNPPRKVKYQLVNLDDIQKKAPEAKEINPEVLEKLNLIKDAAKPVKVLAKINKDFKVKALFKVDKFSIKAKEIIESAGGNIECFKR